MDPTNSSNITDEFNTEAWRLFTDYYIIVTGVIIALAIAGNIFNLVAIVRYRHLHRKQNALIASLSAADLTVGVLALIRLAFIIFDETSITWHTSYTVLILFMYVSYLHLIVIGFHRFIAVTMPLRYSKLVSRKTIMVMIFISWTLPIIIGTPIYTYAVGRHDVINGEVYVLVMHRRVVIALYFTNLIVLSALYGTIFWKTRKQSRKVQAWNNNKRPQGDGKNTRASQSKSTKLVLIIILTALILNFPFALAQVLSGLEWLPVLPLAILKELGRECMLANSAINVFIYCMFANEFRRAYASMLCCCVKGNSTEKISDISRITKA